MLCVTEMLPGLLHRRLVGTERFTALHNVYIASHFCSAMSLIFTMQALQQALLNFSKWSHCAENYVFIASVRAYKSKMQMGDVAGVDAQRFMLIENFILGGELQLNLPSWIVEETIVRATRRSPNCFDAAADEVCKLMSTDIWPRFACSAEYLSLTAVERQSAYSAALVLQSSTPRMSSSGCVAYKQHRRLQQQLMTSAAAARDDSSRMSKCESISSRYSVNGRLLKSCNVDTSRPASCAAPFQSVTSLVDTQGKKAQQHLQPRCRPVLD
jgi:Regulator of G protein signaling domain